MRYRLQRHDGTDCSATMVPITVLRMVPIQRYRQYDFGNGEWNNKYIVTDLLESGSMIWTAKDNENDVNKYIRCEKVPENIIAEAKVDKGE